MCGIVGFLNKNNRSILREDVLLRMRDAMEHRGPDDAGDFLEGPVGMAHRRLSIIDLASGHQPMRSEDGNLHIVFNGEIYNYRELRKGLRNQGYTFKTNSDTEVILHMFASFGEQCVGMLNGIFAFAIWNRSTQQLFLARDHMGVKPLYTYDDSSVFIFASEIKSILESGRCKRECNRGAVREYFLFRQVAGEQTMFEGITSLLPGHYMAVEKQSIQTTRFWTPDSGRKKHALCPSSAVDELDRILSSAVAMQMMSDVPLGTFCSGGVDSSLVSAIAARYASRQINTFSVGFEEKGYDESKYARLVSKEYNTNHHEIQVGNTEFADHLARMIWHNDEPLNFANSVHIYALSRLAKTNVTVVLTGEGADELFAGYPRYYIPRLSARLLKQPEFVKTWIRRLAHSAGDHRLRKLSRHADFTLSETILLNASTLDLVWLDVLFPEGVVGQFPYREYLLRTMGGRTMLERVAGLDQATYLVSILNRQDKMSMAASVESRVPILDFRLVEFANSLPDEMKQRGTQTKWIWKKLAERYLPKQVVHRRKSGFGVPLENWFRSSEGLGELAWDVLSDTSLEQLEMGVRLQDLLKEHRSGSANHAEFLWTALNFVLWKKTFAIS